MFTIKEIAYTGYPVTDMPRARAFYEGVLGLKPSATFEQEGRSWIEYDLGPHTLAVTNISQDWKPSADGPVAALEVEDFDAAVAALRRDGTRFLIEPMDTGACRMAIFADPDGNSLALHRRKG